MNKHRKQRQVRWLAAFRFLRHVLKYEPGQARHYARMRVDKDLAANRG
jgi:hypothetical protein